MSKLDDQRKKYDIPPIPYLPMGKNVIIWRLEAEEKTRGGIIVPDAHKEVKSRGILLAAGLEARDVLRDALIEIGDEVCFSRWGGTDREAADRTVGASSRKTLECKVEDVLGSVDALERVKNYDLVVYQECDACGRTESRHFYEERK